MASNLLCPWVEAAGGVCASARTRRGDRRTPAAQATEKTRRMRHDRRARGAAVGDDGEASAWDVVPGESVHRNGGAQTRAEAAAGWDCSRRSAHFAPRADLVYKCRFPVHVRLAQAADAARGGSRRARRDADGARRDLMFGFLTSGAKDIADPLASAKSRVGVAAAAAGARRHRPPAARHARLRRDAPVAPAARPRPRAGDRVPRRRAGRRPPPADQAIRRELRQLAPKLAERIWQAIYDLSQGFMYAYQAALEEALRQTPERRAGSR